MCSKTCGRRCGRSWFDVGQAGSLQPIGNRPAWDEVKARAGPIANRPQVSNLPHLLRPCVVQRIENQLERAVRLGAMLRAES